jgi:lysophospholipase L1-like esterase
MGVLGDSYSAQYGGGHLGENGARNWVEILSAMHRVSFAPRRGQAAPPSYNPGFPYDWAFVTATSEMVLRRQLPYLLPEVASGQVNYVTIFSGINDFGAVVESAAFDPELSPAELDQQAVQALNSASDNLNRMVLALLQANPDVKVVLATIPDLREVPMMAQVFHRPGGRAVGEAVALAEQAYNNHIRMLGNLFPAIAVADVASTFQGKLASSPSRVSASTAAGPAPLFTPDGMHPTTVPQGWIANDVLEALRSKFHVSAPEIPDGVIAHYASVAQRRQAAGLPLP